MYRNGRRSPVRMAKKKVASASAYDFEAKPLQDANQFLAFQARKASHTEIC